MMVILRFGLTLIAVAGLYYTIKTLIESKRDREALLRSGRNGAMVDLAYQSEKRETIRLTKHVLIVGGVALAMLPFFEKPEWKEFAINARSTIFVVVSMLLAYTSRQDLIGGRRVIRKQAKEIEKALESQP
jgi:hypothetical protein